MIAAIVLWPRWLSASQGRGIGSGVVALLTVYPGQDLRPEATFTQLHLLLALRLEGYGLRQSLMRP